MTESYKPLTKNEELVLYGLVKFPEKNDKQLAQLLEMKDSTLTSIKKRLEEQKFFKTLYIPMLNRLGCEMLGIISSTFNPIIPLEERIKITSEKIERFEEIFFSMGELEKGFSLSFSKDFSSFANINEVRTETFGQLGLLENNTPTELIFPFKLSQIKCFFACDRILEDYFNIQSKKDPEGSDIRPVWFENASIKPLTIKERKVLVALIKNPNMTMEKIGEDENVELSRHTVARMKRKFLAEGLIKKMIIPDLKSIGFNILVFYTFRFNPSKPAQSEDLEMINSKSTLFFAHRKFNAVMLSVYATYSDYKEDKMRKFTYLKDQEILTYNPAPKKYVFDQMEIIKYFKFAPITEKILLSDQTDE